MKGCVCVDVETTGPHPETHEVVEVAWWAMDIGERGVFIPPHTLTGADDHALSVNRYWTRGLWKGGWDDGTELARFHTVLASRWVVGANPGFDWAFLRRLFIREGLSVTSLSYPPLDLPAYAAGVLGQRITDRMGLSRLCRLLGVEPGDHTAEGDVRACVECLLELHKR